MLCQVCGKVEANVTLTDIVDGQKRSTALCATCAQEKGFVIDPAPLHLAAAQIKKILGPIAVSAVEALAALNRECPKCGITWQEFRKSNRFGCPEDYTVFGEDVENLLSKLHGSTEHAGRTSARAQARAVRLRKLETLRGELDSAIASEDYERAAEVRDRIRCFERDGDDAHGSA